MTTRRASQLAIAYNPDWKKQSAWDTPLDGSLLTKAFPATSRNYLDLNEVVEDIEDCTGEDLLFELLTGRSARLNIDFDVDPDVFAGLVAFAYGVAAAPTGGTNEVQTEAMTATGGSRVLTVQTGADTQSTAPIAFDAAASAIQTALEALSNVAPGDISVAAGAAETNEVQREVLTASGGSRTLSFDGHVTSALNFNATAGAIQTALEALTNIAPGDVTVSKTGGTDEVQQEVVVADDGTRTLSFGGDTTTDIPWDADAPTIQAALEALASVAPGDITVGGSAGTFSYTFGGAYSERNVAQIVSDATNLINGLGAGTSTMSTLTPGIARFVYTFAGTYANTNVPQLVSNGASLTGGSSTMSTTTGGAAGTFTYTFGGALGKQNVNLIAVNTFGLTGGTSSFSTTTPGVGLTHAISRMTGYTLPLMTLYVGFRGSDKQPKIFKNVVVNSFRVRGQTREKVTANVELIGSGDLEDAVGFSMPDCQDLLPIRFGDCAMSIAGTDYIGANLGREFEYYFQNDVNPKFDGAGIDSTRAERADKRPSQYSFFVLGEPGDALDLIVKLRASFPVSLQLGPAGRYVKCTSPQALVKQAPTAIRFGGDPPESELAIIGRPRKVSGDATTPTTVEAKIATTATLLTSA